MGSEFYNNFTLVKKIFQEADEKLKFPLSKMILEGPEDQLQLTKNTQPAILTVSYAIFKVLIDEFNFDLKSTKYFAGHSLENTQLLFVPNHYHSMMLYIYYLKEENLCKKLSLLVKAE